jgi:hypothetical protein
MKLTAWICSLSLLVVLTMGAAEGRRADAGLVLIPGAKGTLASTDVFRLQVSLNGQALPDEWTSPATGAYSTTINGTKYWFDRGDALIARRPDLGGTRALYHGDHAYLRALSSRDIEFRTGSLLVWIYLLGKGDQVQGDPKPTFKASTKDGRTVIELHAFYTHETTSPDPMNYRVTVVEHITLAEARHRGLLQGRVKPTSTTWESRPGTPARAAGAVYWLGPRVGSHVAVMTEETKLPADSESSYLVWYAAPSSVCGMRDGTAGKNHWWPGLGGNNCEEWEVSTPANGVQGLGSGARSTTKITLADGEAAELIRVETSEFYVRTSHAIVQINTGSQASLAQERTIAKSLRRVQP